MNSSPSEVIRQLLIDQGLGSATTLWTVYTSLMPETPDNCILVSDTEAVQSKRNHATGVTSVIYGLQIMVRGTTAAVAQAKAAAINASLDADVYRETVVVGTTSYLVQAVSRIGSEISVGNDGATKRKLFTTNVMASITQL